MVHFLECWAPTMAWISFHDGVLSFDFSSLFGRRKPVRWDTVVEMERVRLPPPVQDLPPPVVAPIQLNRRALPRRPGAIAKKKLDALMDAPLLDLPEDERTLQRDVASMLRDLSGDTTFDGV